MSFGSSRGRVHTRLQAADRGASAITAALGSPVVVLESLRAVWEAVLGASDLEALDELYATVIWIPDGGIERLDAGARAYREIVGEPEASDGDGTGNDSSATGSADEAAQPSGSGGTPGEKGAVAGSLADTMEQAIANARGTQVEQLDADVDLQRVLREARARGGDQAKLGRGRQRDTDGANARPRRRPPAVP